MYIFTLHELEFIKGSWDALIQTTIFVLCDVVDQIVGGEKFILANILQFFRCSVLTQESWNFDWVK
jgi:hypothetical protein